MADTGEIQVSADREALAAAAAGRFAARIERAVEERGSAAVALAGGSTPRRLYEVLAAPPHRDGVPWAALEVFWSDERVVPPDDPRSNYRLAHEVLLAHVAVRAERIHPLPAGSGDRAATGLAAAAHAHARLLAARLPAGPGGWPRFDLVLLGLGADGHTASLFPGDPALDETRSAVAVVEAPREGTRRLTLTLPVLAAAACVVFLVAGGDKAAAVRRVLAAREPLPAARVRPVAGELVWLLDREAARLL